MKSGAKQYVRACRNMLPFYGKKERTFIKKLADDLDQEKDYATICEEAGNPKDTAMAYLENCDEDSSALCSRSCSCSSWSSSSYSSFMHAIC